MRIVLTIDGALMNTIKRNNDFNDAINKKTPKKGYRPDASENRTQITQIELIWTDLNLFFSIPVEKVLSRNVVIMLSFLHYNKKKSVTICLICLICVLF
jgi:hypothetical protein